MAVEPKGIKGSEKQKKQKQTVERREPKHGENGEESAQTLLQLLEALKAIKRGDFSVRLPLYRNRTSVTAEIAREFNDVADLNERRANEFIRIGRVVGREGRMTERASLGEVSGMWAASVESLNALIEDLARPTTEVARVISAVAQGDLSQKMALEIEGRPVKGEFLRIGTTVNTMVDQLSSFAAEVTRVAREVGNEGRLGGQADVRGVSGTWKDLTDNVNQLAGNLTSQVRNIAKVTTAVAKGDLSQKITVDAKGEILELKSTINVMVDQLNSFAAEVTRVAREVGTEGKLGGQADVKGVSGTWKDLTDNVNLMASNLTTQVRGIVKVVTAVANGDLTRKFVVEAKGEIAALADTINSMTDTLRIFADQVTGVAREVGIEGKLGGQAKVPGAAGTWKDLTDNVNQLAGNLTSQVRAIAEVATAVTKGDLTRSITVEAQGEVSALKNNINQMIGNLKDTTQKNTEQDWLKTNLAKFSGMMQGQKNLKAVSKLIMSELTPLVSAHHGAFFMIETEDDQQVLKMISSYAYRERKHFSNRFYLGEGLVGQCALEKKSILLTKVPADYIQIVSGLGEAPPLNIIVLPVLFEGEVKAVIELASFQPFSQIHQIFLDQLMESIGVVLNMITASMRTEELLQELQRSNAELEAQAKELEEKASLLEVKNKEVELASVSLEEKAEQLSLISKYKSEFLANMSHELRTPLNSLLILSKLLSENKETNLTAKQVEYAQTIYSSGSDLLALINEILDLSKVESGKMGVVTKPVSLTLVQDYVERGFREVAQQKGLGFEIEMDSAELPESLKTDEQRLQQVLKNLLSNAFKFTEQGKVILQVKRADKAMKFESDVLNEAEDVLAFSVIDTGIGIPKNKQKLIFEAFQQADGTTSRKYGGTGLGLTISREIARLLGGEIHVESTPGKGSEFTFYLPQTYSGSPAELRENRESRIETMPTPVSSTVIGPELAGKRILVIDDDVRNIFAVTSMLETYGMKVVFAENGKDGIETLKKTEGVDMVLIDVMMPEMDGYETTRAIRKIPKYKSLPIIALTAKAMKGDREKCIAAGVSDYITKPANNDQLLSMIKTWLDRAIAGKKV